MIPEIELNQRKDQAVLLSVLVLAGILYLFTRVLTAIPIGLASGGLVFLGVSVMAYFIIKEQCEFRLSIIGPATIFSGIFVYTVYLRTIGILYLDIPPKLPSSYTIQDVQLAYFKGTSVVFIFLLAMFAVFAYANIRDLGIPQKADSYLNRLDNSADSDRLLPFVVGILTSLVIATVGFYLMSDGNVVAFFDSANRNFYMGSIQGRIGYMLLMFSYPVPAVATLLFVKTFESSYYKENTIRLFTVLAILFALALMFTHRSRGLFIAVIFSIWVVLIFTLPRRKLVLSVVFVVTVFGVLLLFPIGETVLAGLAEPSPPDPGTPSPATSTPTPTIGTPTSTTGTSTPTTGTPTSTTGTSTPTTGTPTSTTGTSTPTSSTSTSTTGTPTSSNQTTTTPTNPIEDADISLDPAVAMRKLVKTSGSKFDNVVTAVALTPQAVPHDHGKHFFGIAFEFLPPEDRPVKGSEGFTHAYFPEIADDVGRASPMISEFFWSFGYLGVGIIGAISGLWLAIWSSIVGSVAGSVQKMKSDIKTPKLSMAFIAPLLFPSAIMPTSSVTQFIPKYGLRVFTTLFILFIILSVSKIVNWGDTNPS
jgi:hypothetical protein